jgi:hypothetical protein
MATVAGLAGHTIPQPREVTQACHCRNSYRPPMLSGIATMKHWAPKKSQSEPHSIEGSSPDDVRCHSCFVEWHENVLVPVFMRDAFVTTRRSVPT